MFGLCACVNIMLLRLHWFFFFVRLFGIWDDFMAKISNKCGICDVVGLFGLCHRRSGICRAVNAAAAIEVVVVVSATRHI